MANQRLNTTITIGGAVTAGLRSAFGSTVDSLRRIGSSIRDVQRQQRDVGAAISAARQTGASVVALQRQYDALGASIDRMRAAQTRLANNQRAVADNTSARAGYRSKIGETVAMGIGAAGPIVAAAKFEKAMLGVAKQVDGARDSGGQLTATYYDMGKSIQQMGREIPIATNELADMVTAGARMGIGKNMKPEDAKKTLLDFTRTSAMMAAAFELPAAELSDNMGKIAGIFKIPIKDIADLGDAINYLDDNAISKGGDIIKVMQGDLAGAASTMGMSAKNAAALASTFLTLGESAERADTAASGMLRELNNAKMNPKRFQVGLKMIGMTGDQLQKGMIKDSQGTIMEVLGAIKKLPQEKQMEAVTRLFGKDWGGAIAKLANGVEEYRRQIELANGAAAKGSMSREFAATLATTSAQWTILKNRVTEVAVNLGSVLLPTVNQIIGRVGEVTTRLAEWAREHPKVTRAVVGTMVALTSIKVVAWAAGYAFTFLKGAVLAVSGGFARATAAWAQIGVIGGRVASLGRAIAFAFALAGPPLWVVAAAGAAVVAAGIGIYKYWEPIKAFFAGFGEGLVAGMQPVADAITAAFAPVVAVVGPIVKPILDGIGEWVRKAAGWFGELLTPITATSETTTKLGEAGKVCGEVVATAFTVMLAPIKLVLDSIKWINDNIGGVIDKASKLGATVANGWQATKDFVTGGPTPAAAAVPALRGAAAAGAAGGNTNTVNVYQQPGQDQKALADEVMRRMNEKNRVNGRSRMTDE